MEPSSILVAEKTLKQLQTVCERRFDDSPEADECFIFILDECKKNDFQKIRDFSGKSKLKTYLYSVFNRLVIDFQRIKYGRRRFPTLIQRMGKWAKEVYRLVCWQKYSYDEAWEIISCKNIYTKSFENYLDDIEEVSKAPCKEEPATFPIPKSDDEEQKTDLPDKGPESNPFEALLKKLDRKRRLKAEKVIQIHTKNLDPEQQLLFKLIYLDNHSIAAAGRVIGLSSVQANRKQKKMLLSYKEALLREGITGL